MRRSSCHATTDCSTLGATTLMADISVMALRTPTVSIFQAARHHQFQRVLGSTSTMLWRW